MISPAVVTKRFIQRALCLTLIVGWLPHASAESFLSVVERGAYLARIGDCVACHTAPGGKPFAGGLRMDTPMGAIFSTNISPDKDMGIGDYTEAEFIRAVRQGVARDGHRLYPAMPYPSYAKTSDEDMKALYAYFMNEVPPISEPNKPSEIPWILRMRWPLIFWNFVFLDNDRFVSRASQSDEWNRGAYLVQSLGHCGACHTPRGIGFQEKALDESGTDFLSGAEVDHWYASNLTGNHNTGLGRWTLEDIQQFLEIGANQHASAFGSMTEVINNSTQNLTPKDLRAIAVYLKSLPGARDDDGIPWQPVAALPQTVSGNRGSFLYTTHCGQCHGADGRGHAPWLAPLAGNPNVLEPDSSSLINVTLNGALPIVLHGVPAPYPMPNFRNVLDDQDVADVVNYMRTTWNNKAPAVSPAMVAKLRSVTHPASD